MSFEPICLFNYFQPAISEVLGDQYEGLITSKLLFTTDHTEKNHYTNSEKCPW